MAIERVTLKEVAARAGVSTTTISKVLNGAPDVSAATRGLVEDHLRESGYRRRRSRQRSEYVEIVLAELEGDRAVAIIEGVRDAAAEAGLAVTLSVAGDRHPPGEKWLEPVLRRRPTGIILMSAGLSTESREKLTARGIPFVLIDPAGDPDPGVPTIGAAHWSGGLQATRHLIGLGHRRIAAITGPRDVMSALARLDGYRSAMRAAGLPVDAEWVRFGEFRRESGERHAAELLRLPEPPSAIFAANDLQALGVLHSATALGVVVPRELSVVGYDDLPVAQLANPRLTTVHQPLREIGEQATRLVLRLSDGRTDVTRVELATSLVVRGSTAAPSSPAPWDGRAGDGDLQR